VIDAVRMCKLGLNHGVGGQLDGPSSYLMKSPQNQRVDAQAREDTEKFIAKYAGKPKGSKAAAAAKKKATAKKAPAKKAPAKKATAKKVAAKKAPAKKKAAAKK